jgi:hypothetical protein
MIDFWQVHGFLFIIFMFFFPRLTLLFSSVISGGLLWWLGWFFAPRLLVAILATNVYWNTNPVLVVFTWVWTVSGESTEKSILSSKYKNKYKKHY